MGEWDSTKSVCRVCLTETGEFRPLFTSVELEDAQSTMQLSKMLFSFTRVQMTLGDGLPEQICMSCAEETIKMYCFKLRCVESDRLLRRKLFELRNNKDNIQDNLKDLPSKEKEESTNYIDLTIKTDIEDDYEDSFDNFNYTNNEKEAHFYKSEKTIVEKVKEFECNICQKRFSRKDLLLRHKIVHVMKIEDFKDKKEGTEEDNQTDNDEGCTHTENVNIEIDETFAVDDTPNTIIPKIEDSVQLITCVLCLHIFVNEKIFDEHLVEEHLQVLKSEENENIFICKICNNRIKDLNYFKKHISNYHSVKKSNFKYSCPHCFMKYTRQGPLKNHLKFHKSLLNSTESNEITEYPCKHCNMNFITKEELNRHLKNITVLSKKVSSRKKSHVCEICLKVFTQISSLKDHLRTHNGEKPFLCPTCGKCFNHLGNLRQHQVRHTGVKSHICNTCGSGFASKGELHAHLRKHTGAKPFVCDTCGNGFTTSSSLTKHKRIHSGEKPYECDYCKMKFSRSGILSRHRRIHTGEKPYICKFCKKAFTQSNDLNSHLRIHTGEKPYICDQCGQSFRRSSALRIHEKTHSRGTSERSQNDALAIKNEDKIYLEDLEQI